MKQKISAVLAILLLFSSFSALAYPAEEMRPQYSVFTDFSGHVGYRGTASIVSQASPNLGIAYANHTRIYNPDDPTAQSSASDFVDNQQRVRPEVIRFDTETGIYGKTEEDVALKASVLDTPVESQFKSGAFVNVAPTNDNDGHNTLYLEEGGQFAISFDIAMADFNVNRSIEVSFADNDKTYTNYNPLLQITKTQGLQFFKSPVTLPALSTNKWYNVQIVFTAGSDDGSVPNKAALYWDNQLVSSVDFSADGKLASSDVKKLRFIRSFRLWSTMDYIAESQSYTPNVTYYDNIYAGIYDASNPYVPSTFILTHEDSQINSQLSSGIIDLYGRSMTASELLGGFSAASNLQNIRLVNLTGEELTGETPVEDGYLIIETQDNSTYYIKVLVSGSVESSMYWEDNFDAYASWSEATSATNDAAVSNGALGGNPKTNHRIAVEKGVLNKSDSDGALVLENQKSNYTSGCLDPFFSIYGNNYTGASIRQKATIEMSIATLGAEDGYASFNISASHSDEVNGANTIFPILDISSSGSVSLCGTPIDLSWSDAQWHRLAFTMAPGTSTVTIYLDDEEMGTYPITRIIESIGARLKMGYVVTQASSGQQVLLGIDDFKFYSGDYVKHVEDGELTLDAYEPVTIDEENRVIFYPDDYGDGSIDIYDLDSNLIYGAEESIAFYEDTSYATTASTLYPDYIAVLTSADGNSYRYYTLQALSEGSCGIISCNSPLSFNNDLRTVSGLALGTPVSALLESITFLPNNTGNIYRNDAPLSPSDSVGEGCVLRISNGENYLDYTLNFDYLINESFNNVTIDSTTGANGGHSVIVPDNSSGIVRTTTVSDHETPVLEVISGSDSASNLNIGLQNSRTADTMGKVIAVEISMKYDAPDLPDEGSYGLINLIAKKDGKNVYYSPMRLVRGYPVMTFEQRTNVIHTPRWNRYTIIFDQTSGQMKSYINGRLVVDRTVASITNLGTLQNFRIQLPSVAGIEQTLYADDYKVYSVYDINYFDKMGYGTEVSTTASSYIRDGSDGALYLHTALSGSVETFLSAVTSNADLSVWNADGTQANASESIVNGMILRAASKDGVSICDYILTNEILFSSVSFTTSSPSVVSASCTVFTPDPTDVTLLLASYDADGRLVSVVSSTASGEAQSETLTATAEGVESDYQVKAMLLKSLSSLEPLMPAAEYTQQAVILKLDDVREITYNAFQKVKEYAQEEGIVASFGVIGDSLENAVSGDAYCTFLQQCDADGFEIWHHGYYHTREEYNTNSYEQQLEDFGATMNLLEEKCGITLHSFGSPYNNATATTTQMIAENFGDKIDTLMLVGTSSVYDMTNLNNYPQMESTTGVVDYEYFLQNYEQYKDAPYIVLQGHPANWNDAAWEEFDKIVAFLKSRGATFTTPHDYTQSIQ